MRKTLFVLACLVVIALVAIPLLQSRIWQFMHGNQFVDGRISMQLNPNWITTDKYGRPMLERPWHIPTVVPAVDTLMVHQSNECLPSGLAQRIKDRLTNLHTHFNAPASQWFEITTQSEIASCISSNVTSTSNAGDHWQDMECFLPKDGTLLSMNGRDPAKTEAIEMIRSLRITKACAPNSK